MKKINFNSFKKKNAGLAKKKIKVGLTYDLRDDYLKAGYSELETAEFDRPETIRAIAGALKRNGYKTERIGNIKALVQKLASGKRWDIVFNICEGLKGPGREAQVPALLEAYDIPYVFSDALVMSLSLNKGLTKRVLRDAGIPTPDFHIIENENDIKNCLLPFPVFIKPIAEGTGKGVTSKSKTMDKNGLFNECRKLLKKFKQPVLAETFLPGREFTAGVAGTGKDAVFLGIMEIVLNQNAEGNAYSYANKENCEELIDYKNVTDKKIINKAKELSLKIWRILGCRDGGRIDFKCDKQGRLSFIEINPLAGLHPFHSDLPMICTRSGISYDKLIKMIMRSALKNKNVSVKYEKRGRTA